MIKDAITGAFYSSFRNDVEIRRNQAVITVLSGSSIGGHASIYVEHLPQGSQIPEMLICDLGTVDGSRDGRVWVNKYPVQMMINGEIASTKLPKMTVNNVAEKGRGVLDTHHT